MSEHTPGPFQVEEQQDIDEEMNGYRWAIRSNADGYHQNIAYASSRSEAERIVRACNAHDDLLAAAEAIQKWLGAQPAIADSGSWIVYGDEPAFVALDAAIAKARQE